MRKPEEFKKQVEAKGITFWPSHPCSLCGHVVGHRFINGEPFYDSNCDCVIRSSPLQPRTWESVAQNYNMQTTPEVIEEMDKFWGFEPKRTEINYDTLISAGFQPCIFAPIYLTQYTFYLGHLDWSLAPPANNLNWHDAKMLIAVSADGESYLEYNTQKRFWTIEEIKAYCKKKNIKMTASSSPIHQKKLEFEWLSRS